MELFDAVLLDEVKMFPQPIKESEGRTLIKLKQAASNRPGSYPLVLSDHERIERAKECMPKLMELIISLVISENHIKNFKSIQSKLTKANQHNLSKTQILELIIFKTISMI